MLKEFFEKNNSILAVGLICLIVGASVALIFSDSLPKTIDLTEQQEARIRTHEQRLCNRAQQINERETHNTNN